MRTRRNLKFPESRLWLTSHGSFESHPKRGGVSSVGFPVAHMHVFQLSFNTLGVNQSSKQTHKQGHAR